MEEQKLYNPTEDARYTNPYIDVEEWRDNPFRHFFVHGGFKGTDINGEIEAKFCMYFPEKEAYEGRFYQYLSPAPEDEYESEHMTGEDDKIRFALSHGAYYVVSNQGGFIPGVIDRMYQTSANAAEYSRIVANRVYGYAHRPYGYVFGGSGGSYKTLSCVEMTEGIWDGSVPYVIGNPMSTPNVFCSRVRAMRILGEEGLQKVVAAMEPGGSGNIYEGLNEEQIAALEEASAMGFPDRGWFSWPYMGDGALMVLMPHMYQIYPQYFSDFWTQPGFAGADPNSSEARARVQFVTTVKALLPRKKEKEELFVTVDNSWKNTIMDKESTPQILMSSQPAVDAYLVHSRLKILSGALQGKEAAIDTIEGNIVTVSNSFERGNILEGLQPGDTIMIDNSDYLAMQTLQRHQIPDESYKVYDQYRNPDGSPKYPQLPFLIAPQIALGGGGSSQTGHIHGKMIAVCNLVDECAYAWQGDWYKKLIEKNRGGNAEDCFRLYYNDHCTHDDTSYDNDKGQHQVDYLGILHQALLDVAAWCEKGIEPLPSTNYKLVNGQVIVPDSAKERCGLQPVVHAFANGEKAISIHVGQEVSLMAEIEVPTGAGSVTAAFCDYEMTGNFEPMELHLMKDHSGRARAVSKHVFLTPGVYYATIRAQSNRNGTLEDIFTQCRNLDRVRVEVNNHR